MTDKPRVSGLTTIAPEVIETIIKMTATETKGVAGISVHKSHPGVKIKVDEKSVGADIYVILNYRENSTKVGKALQENIARAISEMLDLTPGIINIHVDDFAYLNEVKEA